MVDKKQLGIIIMLAVAVLFAIGFLYVKNAESFLLSQAETGQEGECIHFGKTCPYEQLNRLAVPKFIGGFALLALFAAGLFLFLKKKPEETALIKARKEVKGLGKEEKDIFEMIINTGGMVFQNELVQKSGLSKVKITRILDKLESRGIIERRRRGMTNIVILKQ